MGTNGPRGDEAKGLKVDGHTFWRAGRDGVETELTSETGIELDAERCTWTVSVAGGGSAVPVESRSSAVRHFMLGVVEQMDRATRRAARRPVPKPAAKPGPRLPAGAPVPCPLCGGSAWHGCELCDGEGAVTQERAAYFEDLHGH